MQSLADFPPDSTSEHTLPTPSHATPPPTRKGRPKRTRSEAELLAAMVRDRQELKALRRAARNQAIATLGRLAYQAGLRGHDPERLAEAFKRLVQQGVLVLVLMLAVT